MVKYRKKPVVIEAVEWRGDKDIVGVCGVGCVYCWPHACLNYPHTEFGPNYHHGEIDTLEGKMEVSRGDFVITGVKGERYPCKPDIFAATYELVD